jgi:glycosyltransferase involved in cell wall biosynthesis
MKLISVCIPTYEMGGSGHIFLKESLDILCSQTFKDFDVVISDGSKDDHIKNLCDTYTGKLDLHYFRNRKSTGASSNINNSIRNATGKLIKILCQDDYLFDNKSLEIIAKNFDIQKDTWLVTACTHTKDKKNFFKTFSPRYNKKIHLGKNTIGSPSVTTIKNEKPLFFDESFMWLLDCDYYKRYYDTYGPPKIVREIGSVIRIGEHQLTKTEATLKIRSEEFKKIFKKYNINIFTRYRYNLLNFIKNFVKKQMSKKTDSPLVLKDVTLVAVSGIDPGGAINALEKSMEKIDYHEVILISHAKPENLNPKIIFKQCKPTELVSKDPKNTNDYSHFMLYSLKDYINSDFVLIVHNNAYVIHPEKWTSEFLNYDYIGAPWPKNIHRINGGPVVRVGNGGFSLRSKKMLTILSDLNLPFTDKGTGFFHEDGVICVYYRKELEQAGIQFAPVELAAQFSHELDCPESVLKPFGFHDYKTTSRFRYIVKFKKKTLRLIKNIL